MGQQVQAQRATDPHKLASCIRTRATRYAKEEEDHTFPHGEEDAYLDFVRALHQLCASSTTPNSLRWHARLALYEMGEE